MLPYSFFSLKVFKIHIISFQKYMYKINFLALFFHLEQVRRKSASVTVIYFVKNPNSG